jgi:RHS repeat-associated protein
LGSTQGKRDYAEKMGVNYSTFGAPLPGRTFNSSESRYGFQGQEKIDELHGNSGDSYDFGARIYDARLGRWLSADPLERKFPNYSTYTFCFDNTIIVVDLDGMEGIVVSGSPGKESEGGHKGKTHFLDNGLDRAKQAKKRAAKGEQVTWIIYNDPTEGAGYSDKSIEEYKKKAKAAGINVIVVTDSDEIVDYVNTKSTDGSNEDNNDKDDGDGVSDARENDKVSSFYYIGHATPGDLDVGYAGSGDDFDPSDFESEAFASGAYVDLVGGCRTAIAGTFEDSNVTQFQDILDNKSTIKGSDVRVYYPGGVVNNEQLVEHNNGKVIERKGNLDPK